MRRQNISEKKRRRRRTAIGTQIRKKVSGMKGKRGRKQREVHVEEDKKKKRQQQIKSLFKTEAGTRNK